MDVVFGVFGSEVLKFLVLWIYGVLLGFGGKFDFARFEGCLCFYEDRNFRLNRIGFDKLKMCLKILL